MFHLDFILEKRDGRGKQKRGRVKSPVTKDEGGRSDL